MLTVEKVKNLITKKLLNSLQKDNGITEFFVIGDYSIGISYETGDVSIGEESERYILNVFSGDEYLNVSYVSGNNGLNDRVYQELVDTYNKYCNVNQYLASKIRDVYSIWEIEDIIGEQVTADIVENLDERIESEISALSADGLHKILSDCLDETEIKNMLYLLS